MALNNLQRLICHETQTTNRKGKEKNTWYKLKSASLKCENFEICLQNYICLQIQIIFDVMNAWIPKLKYVDAHGIMFIIVGCGH